MFPTTRWSVFVAGREDREGARAALEYLCAAYRRPVLAYIRRRGVSGAEAEDLTQSFFAALIERRIETRADPLRGRFRALLLTALKRYLANAEAARRAAVRGGGISHATLEELAEPEAAGGEEPESVFLRHWAMALLQRALQTLREEAEASGKLALFEALRPFLVEAPEAEDYAQLAARFSMRPNTLAVSVHRLRQRLRERVRDELAETVASEDELQVELDVLREALGGVIGGKRGARGGEGSSAEL